MQGKTTGSEAEGPIDSEFKHTRLCINFCSSGRIERQIVYIYIKIVGGGVKVKGAVLSYIGTPKRTASEGDDLTSIKWIDLNSADSDVVNCSNFQNNLAPALLFK